VPKKEKKAFRRRKKDLTGNGFYELEKGVHKLCQKVSNQIIV
jgi:hypothetical protein